MKPEVLAHVLRDLAIWEGSAAFMYLDTRGYVTVGVGNLLATPEAAEALPFVTPPVRQRGELERDYQERMQLVPMAPPLAKRGAWLVVKSMRPALREAAYEWATTLRLPEAAIDDLLRTRLQAEFLPGLAARFPGFDDLPAGPQRALVDIAFNCGLGGLDKFTHLREAILRGDWPAAAAASSRAGSRAARNSWTAELLASASRS
jgi:GH24 family phage-related lysozyme (muramidase)